MPKRDAKESIREQTHTINKRLWIVFLAIAAPFFFLAIAFFLITELSDERLLIVAMFLFSSGIALIAFKLVSYTFISRYLAQIKQLDTAKSDFVSVASHQLKSPVSSLKYTMDVFCEALKEEDWETVREFSGDIKVSVDRLNSLTHQLLDVARAESGTLESHPEIFHLMEKIELVNEELEPIFTGEKITVSVELEIEKDVAVEIDPDYFYNVLANLLTNASKYAPEESDITVSVRRIDNMAKVSVINATTSLDEGDLDSIFVKFGRGSIEKQGDAKGAGLGLFIAKTYVESWGGNIDASLVDKEERKAVFSFTVPIKSVE